MLDPRTLLPALRNLNPEALFVTHLGNTSTTMFNQADAPNNFYMLGSMGGVIPFALGLSLANSQTVIAIEGDGGILMALGTLSTAASHSPKNLKLIILDNGSYATTGGQRSATASVTDIVKVSKGCGISVSRRFDTSSPHTISNWLSEPGLRLAVISTAIQDDAPAAIPLTPAQIVTRFQKDLSKSSGGHP
ncbi:sulfopyruvate decarboxylase subunit beta [Microbacterium sp. Sa4CUA7]|uniref:Sulfopyruvate decarboxylase subunit beta n=1 Tax=Microbacterium pullorum TaxID=2762236 RepID=A0ABR8S353_9MICO|nr:thiamine pyrophosphate-dependent enzyme [Microbacterium pullorum]MBD7957903.1 sulfopyruvate decarboxylase subunit beta [Microbacterium pullorum]